MRASTAVLYLFSLYGAALALPAAAPAPDPAPELEERQLLGALLEGVTSAIRSALDSGDLTSVLSELKSVTATSTPTDPTQAVSKLSSIHATATPSNIYEYAADLIAEGLVTEDIETIVEFVEGVATGENSMSNDNTHEPDTAVYPKKSSSDAPYSVSEDDLRSAIYIPSTFTYGSVPPVILFPGTASTGYFTFKGNFIPLLTGSSYADPVWVNVPGYLLGDAQVNAEYAAYAINYISGITGTNVSVIAWSQGNIDVQWAFKYWPSTRAVTSDHIAISPDYAGTVQADFVCPDGAPCTPSVYQQQYESASNFITTLRNDDGDSAYVPTTTLYSGLFDEIVEPQQGTGASAYLLDARNVGVTNNEVQLICPGQPGGSFYTHESMLANPLSFALAVDALTHDGPGEVSRVDTSSVCASYVAEGLDLADFLDTENTILVAVAAIATYGDYVESEPAVMSYAA